MITYQEERERRMKKLTRLIYSLPALLILALTISACGGGGSGSTGSTPSQGKFVDTTVDGITYKSGTLTGVTDVNGTFSYQSGQPVTFSVGGIVLGTVSGSAIITPVQLVAGATNQTNPVVTNIVQFLLTIDDDNDPANGIQITAAVRAAAAGLSLNFTLTNFDTDGAVSSVINTLTTASVFGSRVLVSNAVAQAHLSSSLFSLLSGSYTGTYGGTDSGNWTIAITTAGLVSGNGTSNSGGPFTITGNVNTSGTTSATASGGAASASWGGIIDITTGIFSGSWSDIAGSGLGTFSGNKI